MWPLRRNWAALPTLSLLRLQFYPGEELLAILRPSQQGAFAHHHRFQTVVDGCRSITSYVLVLRDK